MAKAYAELTAEGWLESRQGLGLYVAPQRQRLSDGERERRLDEAVQHFMHDVIALDFAPDEVLARLEHELRALAPRGPCSADSQRVPLSVFFAPACSPVQRPGGGIVAACFQRQADSTISARKGSCGLQQGPRHATAT